MYIEKLRNYQKEIFDLQHCINVIGWDLRISCPKDEKDEVIKLIGSLEDKLFKLQTSSEYGNILKNAIDSDEFKALEDNEQQYVKALLKKFEKRVNIPSEFYVKYTEFVHKSTTVWEESKKNNDYAFFKPYLEYMIKLTKEYYKYIDNEHDLYDVMLEDYEAGLTSDVIDKLFTELKEALLPIIPKTGGKVPFVKINASENDIMKCAEFLLTYIDFDMNKGALGIYPHGFTEKIGNNDIRIAFKRNDNALDFVSTIIHEGGHGILEQNVSSNLSKYECLTCDGINALHESQSRFFENILGRNINFWLPIYDKVKSMLGLEVDVYEFVDGLNKAIPSLVRTEADELTYCMHIILRYEIERDLFSGKINVNDLPDIWNKKMKEYLGVEVTSDKDGILQDVHWAEGDFGYFPSYLIGSIYDGIFLEIIEKQLGSINEILSSGNIKVITKFLIDNVYVNGGAYTGRAVLKALGVDEISVGPVVNYFYGKYGNNHGLRK